MILVAVLICSSVAVCGQEDQNRWGGVMQVSEEYLSDDVPKPVPDKDTITSALTVPDAGTIIDLNVKVNIEHEWDGNMDVYLIAPDGTRVELFTDVGAISANFDDTVLDNEAELSITEGHAPFPDSYRPEGNLADLYNKDINGTWILEVTDDSPGHTGTLISWSLITVLEIKEPLPAPIIHCEPNSPGGICDTIWWDDVGEICQFESAVGETIPDEDVLTSTLVVDQMGVIEDLNVKVNITHDWDSELDVYLIAPDGTRVELFTDVGGSQDDFNDTILDDEAPLPITAGSAPFTGSYRPEGSLDVLDGKDMNGEWVLEVTDDSWFGSGTLNNWSLTIDKADVLYYAECASDPDFSNVVASSGWMIDRSCTFAGLGPDQEYWYRAKARALRKWLQTSEEDFETDILSDTKATIDGDVVLAGSGGGFGPEVDAIENPSFETDYGWTPGDSSAIVLLTGLGFFPDDLWVSDGERIAGAVFYDDLWYNVGDCGQLRQTVDWTGVDTLVFDYCSFFANDLIARVMIGDQEVWSNSHMDAVQMDHYDETVDVLEFTGEQDLTLVVESKRDGGFLAAVFWDNLRTYGAGGYKALGSVVSNPIKIGDDDTWDILQFDATAPEGTLLTVDILPETGSDALAGYDDVLSGADLSGLGERTVRLRANLSTDDSEATPALHDWSVTYTDAGCESDWSNVASSLQQ